MKIVFVGNFGVSYSSENHHALSLEKLGHQIVRLQEAQVTGEIILDEARKADLLIHVHTHVWETPGLSLSEVLKELKRLGIPTLTYHLDLWMGIARQKDLETDDFYKHIGHFFTVDRLMADWFNENTEVKGHYLRAGVLEDECYRLEPNQEPLNDVIFVGSRGYHPEWQWRPDLIDWLKETYGDRFKHYGGDGLGVMRENDLNQLYANTKVVVGDSLVLNFDYPDYWSDRVYETLGRGGFLLMPRISGLETEFAEDELPTFEFGNFVDLKTRIDFYIEHNSYREAIRQRGFNKVINNYTYTHRWREILKTLELT